MSVDAGLQSIVQAYAPGGGPGVEAEATLTASIGGLATEMRLDRQRRAAFEQRMQAAIRDTSLLSVTLPAGAPQTFTSPDWVCKTGYEWFAQLFTAKNLGSTDSVWVYRTSASGAQQLGDSAAKWLLTNAAPAWAPGRTGFAMKPGDGITVQGTTTNTVTVNIDVIILEQWIVPDFLL
jgi:hypothetical protein